MKVVHEFVAAHGRTKMSSQLPTLFWVGLCFNCIVGEEK